MIRHFPLVCLLFLALLLVQARGAASEALYDGQPVPHWQAALKDSDPKVRRRAAYALGQIGPPFAAAAVSDLSAALADRHVEVAWYAADALGRIGPDAAPAVKALIHVIEETPGEAVLRRNAVIALGRIGKPAEGAIPVLEKVLKSDDAETRVAAGMALYGVTRREAALEPVIADLKATDSRSRLSAALALRGFESTPVATALVAVLDTPDEDLRRAATESLAAAGAAAAAPLIDTVQGPYQTDSHQVRMAVIVAMGQFSDRLRQEFHSAGGQGDHGFPARMSAFEKRLLPALLRLLADPNDEIQAAAARAVARAGPLAVPRLTEMLVQADARASGGAQLAIGQLGPYMPADSIPGYDLMVPPLTAALQHEKREVRAAAFRLFAMLKIRKADEETKQCLQAGLSDPDADIRRHAAASLARLEN